MELNFNVGDAIELTRGGKKYRTVVEKQIDSQTVLIYSPIEKGHVLPIRVGENLDVIFVILDPKQSKYDVYSYAATVIDREVNENVPMLVIQGLGEAKKVQRRDFYRLNIVKTILIENIKDDTTIEVITQDISAGGMQAISPKKLTVDDEYLVYMNIFADFPIVLSAKILSSDPTENEDKRYVSRFYFTNIDKKLQGDMIRQINHLQVLEIRRRRGSSPLYKDALKTYLDEELLDRYNADLKVDKNIRYLSFFNIALTLLLFIVFVMAMPNWEWAPFYRQKQVNDWNFNLLKVDLISSTVLFLVSGIGLAYDRIHYHKRRQVNMFFVVMVFISLLCLLGLVFFTI